MEYRNQMSSTIADAVDNSSGAPNQYHTGGNRVNIAGSFHNAQHVAFHGNPQIITSNRDVHLTTNNTSLQENMLMKLADAACLEAGHEIVEEVDRPKCHEDTRKAVFEDIMSWVDSDNPNEKIMWLKGPAGAGKSSIAQSICIRCRDEGKLLSSFFFSRAAGGGRADGTKLIATIAYQITQEVPETKKYLVAGLAKNPAILSYTAKAMQLQLQKLVLQPLSHAIDERCARGSTVPHLLVIDGLDECHNVQLQSKIITLFATALAPLRVKVKCFIASRPELEIRNAFGEDDVSQLTTEIFLDDKYKPDEDIWTYFMSEFSAIKRLHTLSSRLRQVPNWPAEWDIMELVRRASGQFIYAVTVMRYIKDERRNPITRLQEIMCVRPGEASAYQELDALYTHILNSAAENAEGYENILHVFQIMLYKCPQYPELSQALNMAWFLNVPEDNISLTVADLHSLMFISNDNEGDMKFSHASFIDYLEDESRSRIFSVEEKIAHKSLARYCLVHAVESKSQNVNTDDGFPVEYSHYSYLYHLAESDFDDELLEELLEELKNQEGLQLLIDQFFMRFYIYGNGLRVLNAFYNWELFDEYDEYVARPRLETIRPVCECISNASDDFVVTLLCEFEFKHVLSLKHLIHQDPRDFSAKWTKSIILNPLKGQQFHLGNERCQHIWRRIWKLLQDPKSEARKWVEIADLPILFEYLLKRIKPCPEFKSFLGRFAETFETWFFGEREWETQIILDSWALLQHSISSYIEKCDNLMMSNNLRPIDTSNYPFSIEEMEDTPLNKGVQPPWITTYNESTETFTVTYNPALSEDSERSIGINHQSRKIIPQASSGEISNQFVDPLGTGVKEYQAPIVNNSYPSQDQYDALVSGIHQDFMHESIYDWNTGDTVSATEYTELPPHFYDDFLTAILNDATDNNPHQS